MPSFNVNPKYAGMSELVPGLYISGVCGLKPVDLAVANIGVIVNATNEVPQMRDPGIDRIKLWLDDTPSTPIFEHFDLVSDRIDACLRDDVPVLVHCVAGVSRSAALCLAYLLKYRCASLRDAYHLMTTKRALVRPNIGFWRQLISYEQMVKGGRASVRLVLTEGQQRPSTSSDEDEPTTVQPMSTYMPDVYLTEIIPDYNNGEVLSDKENLFNQDCRKRNSSGSSRRKFTPILDPLIESDI